MGEKTYILRASSLAALDDGGVQFGSLSHKQVFQKIHFLGFFFFDGGKTGLSSSISLSRLVFLLISLQS